MTESSLVYYEHETEAENKSKPQTTIIENRNAIQVGELGRPPFQSLVGWSKSSFVFCYKSCTI